MPRPRRKEALNEQYLIDLVEITGGKTRKVKWVYRRGAPDRFVGWPSLGLSFWIEIKEEEQPWGLQDHQKREIAFLRACGQQVEVLDSRFKIAEFVQLHTGYEAIREWNKENKRDEGAQA